MWPSMSARSGGLDSHPQTGDHELSPSSGARTEPSSKFGFVFADGRSGVLLLERCEARIASIPFGVPLIGKPPALDIIGKSPHRRKQVKMVVTSASRQLTILASWRMVLRLDGV